jgi:hypothetical protein
VNIAHTCTLVQSIYTEFKAVSSQKRENGNCCCYLYKMKGHVLQKTAVIVHLHSRIAFVADLDYEI